MMKKFENPELEIVKLSLLDVITASGGEDDWSGDQNENDTPWH